ncbi:MAG: FxsA family protein [Micropruina sp.]|uniref:FxsA family protein n=1 Tax=Micropruina sp. TaxID=2737536 RepID=UPI0039E4DBFE
MTIPQQPVRGRRPWLAPLVLLFFVTVPVVEVWLLVSVGQTIGVLPTLAVLVVQAFLGGWLMRQEGAKAWRALNESISSGRLPGGQLLDPVLIMVGGVLVMLPGFFTDVFGLIFLLPFTRPLARGLLGLFIARRAARSGIDLNLIRAKAERDTVIRGETVPDQQGSGGSTPDQRSGAGEASDPTVIKGEIES